MRTTTEMTFSTQKGQHQKCEILSVIMSARDPFWMTLAFNDREKMMQEKKSKHCFPVEKGCV
jgi:hypothetical protein